jgi:hypothetical protein
LARRDAGGDLHRDRVIATVAPFALALFARGRDDVAFTRTRWTWCDADELAEKRSLSATHFT